MVNKRQLGPFLGPITALDQKFIDDLNASDCLNVRLENGTISARYGYRTLSNSPSGFMSAHGLAFVNGYNENQQALEEYLSFENRGSLQPYSIHPLTGTRTVITDGASSLSLTAGDWNATSFDYKAFCWAVGQPVYTHIVGSASSWTALDTERPANPSTTPTLSFYDDPQYAYSEAFSGMTWTGASSAVIDSFSSSTSGQTLTFVDANASGLYLDLTWNNSPSSTSAMEIVLDMAQTLGGVQDYSAVDEFYYDINFEWSAPGYTVNMLANGLDTHIINDDGSPLEYNMNNQTTELTDSSSLSQGSNTYLVRCVFVAPRVESQWINTRKVKFIWQNLQLLKTGGGSTSYPATVHIRIGPIIPKGYVPPPVITQSFYKLKFGYTFYDEAQDVESADVKESVSYFISPQLSYYTGTSSASAQFVGNVPVLTVGSPSQSTISHYRAYVQFEDEELWRLMGQVSTTTDPTSGDDYSDPLIQPWELTYLTLRTLPARSTRAYQPIGSVNYALPYSRSMVFLKPGGSGNVLISQVGNPRVLADPNYDLDTDLDRGRTFAMSPGFDDEPIWAGDAADALIMLGHRGAYASTGSPPALMSPPKRLPGSKGVYGHRAAARWTQGGDPGIAYVSNDLELWFANAYPGFDGVAGFRYDELSQPIRGMIRQFLAPTSSALLTVATDERSDSLWITYLDKAIVYRRPSLVNGKRHFEFYQYNHPWTHHAFHPEYGIRSMGASGRFDEREYNSASSFTPIVSALRDAGSAITSMYWTSKEFSDVNRRVSNVLLEREDPSLPVTVQVLSERSTNSRTFPANTKHQRFWIDSQGWQLVYKIVLDDEQAIVTKAVVDENGPSSRQLNR